MKLPASEIRNSFAICTQLRYNTCIGTRYLTWRLGWIPIPPRSVDGTIMIDSTRQDIGRTFAFMALTLLNCKHRDVVVIVTFLHPQSRV
jgi:hypothetical protein